MHRDHPHARQPVANKHDEAKPLDQSHLGVLDVRPRLPALQDAPDTEKTSQLRQTKQFGQRLCRIVLGEKGKDPKRKHTQKIDGEPPIEVVPPNLTNVADPSPLVWSFKSSVPASKHLNAERKEYVGFER